MDYHNIILYQQASKINITIFVWTYDDPVLLVNCECVIEAHLTLSKNCSDCSSYIQKNRKYMARVHCANDIGTSESAVHYLSKLRLF